MYVVGRAGHAFTQTEMEHRVAVEGRGPGSTHREERLPPVGHRRHCVCDMSVVQPCATDGVLACMFLMCRLACTTYYSCASLPGRMSV